MAEHSKKSDEASEKASTGAETGGWMMMKVASVLVLGYLVYSYLPIPVPKDGASAYDNVVYALRWQPFSCLTLAFSVMMVGRARVKNNALDPLSPTGQACVEPYNRRLQNTLEQLTISVIGQLILSTYLQAESLRVIPTLVFIFVTGRILFYAGYPDRRGAGFVLTFFPTLGTYLTCIFFLVTSGPIFQL